MEGVRVGAQIIDPIFFCVPLRGKAVSQSWTRVCDLLERTVTSALAERDASVIVLIACHEIPETIHNNDPRVFFLQTKSKEPTSPLEQMLDKREKKIMLGREVARRGGGYMVMLDSDDLVSTKLCGFIRAADNKRGYLINKGYSYDLLTKRFKLLENFHNECGSCAVFYITVETTPAALDEFIVAIGDSSHVEFGEMSAAHGRSLDCVPFPAIVYLVNHGENHSRLGRLRPRFTALREAALRCANLLIPSRRMPRSAYEEFGLR